jgi:DNA-binding Lrp family transcriptional regulator
LDVADLKVLSYLAGNGRKKGKMIIDKLGFPEKQAINSLEKLMDAKLITYRAGGWQTRKLRDTFSIKKLIAVEAKLSDVSGAVDQSFVNTRFASHSYALINSTNPASETIKRFTEYGIGLYSGGIRFKKRVEAKRYTLPSSYVSYQFNEWIGRVISH